MGVQSTPGPASSSYANLATWTRCGPHNREPHSNSTQRCGGARVWQRQLLLTQIRIRTFTGPMAHNAALVHHSQILSKW